MINLIIEIITALLTTITVGLSSWAAISAKKSAEATQDQYNLAREEAENSKLPLLIPIEFDYHTDFSRINDSLDGDSELGKKFGDLTIKATNVSNAHAFNVVSYLNVRNLEEYLQFVSENPIEDIWFPEYQILKEIKTGFNNNPYLSIGVRNYKDGNVVSLSFYDARNAANAKMAVGKDEIFNVSVNSYAQIILRDYLNRRSNVVLHPNAARVDPHLEIVSRYKTIDQLKTNEYTITKYKVIFDGIASSTREGLSFRLMYEFDTESKIKA